MPQQGPELPPHLVKRKRSIDDAEPRNSPPRKVQAATAPSSLGPASKNPDEVDIDDSSEDDYGPAPQPHNPTKGPSPPGSRTQGPAPPPKNPDELDVGDSSEDDYGPAPQETVPNPPRPPPPPAKRVLGPSLPPADLSTMPSHPADASSDSDSDDGFGPALPPAPGSLAAQQVQEQERAAAAAAALAASSSSSADPAKQRRDDWMLVPPSQDSAARADPTQLKARRFATARGGGPVAPPSKGISAIWTETPDEKRRRLEDEVLGRVEAATSAAPSSSKNDRRGAREDAETERQIREYNERNRGKSLYEAHKDRKDSAEEKEDDPSKRAFDREKDMALGGRLGHGQKKEMMAKAADFGSRFQKGKYL